MEETTQPSSTPTETPNPDSKLKWVIIVVVVALLSSVATYVVLTSQPTQQQPTPTPLPAEVSTKKGDPTANWKTYTNAKADYTLKYAPNSYILHEEGVLYPGKDLLSYISLELCDVAGAPNCGAGADSLSISVYSNTKALSLDDWIEQSENSPKVRHTLCTAKDPRNQTAKIKFLGNNAVEFKRIIDETTIKEVCKDQYPGEFMGESRSIIVERNSTIYIISYSVSSDEQARGVYGDKTLPIMERERVFDQILSTFRFTE